MAIGGFNSDLPSIGASNYASTAYGLAASGGGLVEIDNLSGSAGQFIGFKQSMARDADALAVSDTRLMRHVSPQRTLQPPLEEIRPMTVSTRFVRVIIVDPNENIPLDDRIIYKGDEKATDLNDQELFFELDIKDLLAKHNEKRVKVIDKKVKERTENLEPAKIRDLKMVVVNIATF